MRSFICILMTVVMLLSFASCAGGSGDDTKTPTTTAPTTDRNDINNVPAIEYEDDDLPDDLDFGGMKVTIISEGDKYKIHDICTDELNSDIVNDSIYNRERYVEERLGVEIENMRVKHGDDLENELVKQHSSDDDTFQIAAYSTFAFTRLIFDGYFHDLYGVNYINTDKPWWSSSFNSEAEIDDKLFVTTGSLSLSLTRYLYAIFYNKDLAKDYINADNGKYADLANLYTLVEDGKWTFDKMYELGSSIYVDNNGNTERDAEDIYGLGFQSGISVDTFWSSFDIDIYGKTEDGWFELIVDTEKVYNAMEKLNNMIHNTSGCYNFGVSDGALEDLADSFADNTVLFMNNKLIAIESTTLRNMQSDYGILPFPKYDEKQDGYYSFAHDSYVSFAIPRTNRNYNASGAVLEALASYTYRETEPAYLDTALKGKYMSDPQSRRML
ncbi:MAG: hypothetical protein IKV54_01535, partial [Clostridia bacterium]|nr:hypothetical protein [Clostridia bacterium]